MEGSSKDATPGEATAAAADGSDGHQWGREEREEAEGALPASDPRYRHHALPSVPSKVQLYPKLLGVCRGQRSHPATATDIQHMGEDKKWDVMKIFQHSYFR